MPSRPTRCRWWRSSGRGFASRKRERVQFREIYVSEGFPDLAVIAHPRVPTPTVERVRRALLGMASDPGAAGVLTLAKFKGFEPAADRDYDGVRRIYRLIGQ
jgi:ABC-type phosphate/phosphonate transport system substrate-binding protein